MAKRKMSAAIKRKWVKALRSGKFEQGALALRTSKQEMQEMGIDTPLFCCLGVLCEVTGTPYRPGSVCSAMPSRAARQRLGLDDELADNLAALNDQGTSFKQLANIIEQEA